MKSITWRHLAKHNLSLAEYKQQYPNYPTSSEAAIQRKKAAGVICNASRKGIPRTEEVKQKIRETKEANPKEAWNKDIPRTEEQNKHLSEFKKEQYASGEIIHWNIGNHWSDEVKQKISNTALVQSRTYSEESKHKRRHTIQQKSDIGWIHHSTLNKGKPSNISNHTREKLRALSIERNKIRTIESCNIKNHHLQQFRLTTQTKDGYNFDIHCSVCGTSFSRTASVLVPYRYSLYNGEYCPTCYPPQYGYYSDAFFEQNPKLKDQSGILYIALVNDTEQFIKVGITNRTAHQRLLSEPYDFEILFEFETTIYNAYNLEQEILKTYKNHQYIPTLDFGGKTECLSASILEDVKLFKIIEKYTA
ncbi:MucR family transcriptional regulator [Candidatus Dojkabacteria bacterium]|nr:MucR family transcriptional regulator [Candidatus Dojkabacteria bacterium]